LEEEEEEWEEEEQGWEEECVLMRAECRDKLQVRMYVCMSVRSMFFFQNYIASMCSWICIFADTHSVVLRRCVCMFARGRRAFCLYAFPECMYACHV